MSNYSNDSDLKIYEANVLEYLPDTTPPTASFDAQHAEAKRILDEIIIRRLPEGVKARVKRGEATMNDVVDESDLKTVSVFYTLFVIFNRLSTSAEDIFAVKASKYLALFKEKTADLSFDISTDGNADMDEEIDTGNIRVERG
jgi:hypothetical protein